MTQFWLPGDSDFALALREPNLLVPGKKPIGDVKINWKNSLTVGLTAVAFPTLCGVKTLTVSGDGVKRPTTSNGDAPSNTSLGVGVNGDIAIKSTSSTTDTVKLLPNELTPSEVTPWSPSSAVTALLVSARNGVQGGNCPVFGVSAPYNQPYFGWSFYLDGVSDDVSFTVQTGSGYDGSAFATESTTWTSGEVRVHVGTWDGSNIRLYRGGALQDTTVKSGSAIYNVGGIAIGNFHAFVGNGSFVGDIFLGAVWNRALNADEIAKVSRHPYQILTSANDTPYPISVPAGGGAPVLSSPNAINVQSDRATPQVTLTF